MSRFVASHLKDMNRKIVYKLFQNMREISRAEISRLTGISAPTVLKIVGFLEENGFVVEAGEGDSSLGRKPQLYKFNPEAAYSIGSEIEGDYLRVGIVNLDGKLKKFRQIRVTGDFQHTILCKLKDLIDEMLQEAQIPRQKVLGLCIGIPGVLDSEKNIIHFAPLIGIHEATDFKQLFKDLNKSLAMPVYIENDVNAAAYGEYISRNLPDGDMIYISLGTGLGAGIILDGQLRTGTRGSAGEIGYMVFDSEFQTTKENAGWLESSINLHALASKWGFDPAVGKSSLSEKAYSEMVDYLSSRLGLCIANLSTQLDISIIVLGGITIELLGKELIASVNNYVKKLSLQDTEVFYENCENPGVIGCALIVTMTKLEELLGD